MLLRKSQLPHEVLDLALSFLNAVSLALVARCCKAFRVKDEGVSLIDKLARDQLVRSLGPVLAARWRCGQQHLVRAFLLRN